MNLTLLEVMSASCAVHRTNNGFIKTNDARVSEGLVPNSKIMYDFLLGTDKPEKNKAINERVKVTDADITKATEIIEYLKGLSFKALERNLTAFETNVLKLVTTSGEVSKDQIGIAASLPKVFENKLDQDKWAIREAELVETSDYVGTQKSRCQLDNLTVENVRMIQSVGSYLVCCSQDNRNIVKFFSPDERLTPENVGSTINITAFVKSHQVSDFHGGKETMVNRVKFEGE